MTRSPGSRPSPSFAITGQSTPTATNTSPKIIRSRLIGDAPAAVLLPWRRLPPACPPEVRGIPDGAGVGIAAGSYYPIKSAISAFQRAHPQRVATQETLPAHQEQDSSRTSFMPAAAAPPPVSTEPNPPLQESAGRAVFFNPGTVAPPAAQDAKPTRSPSTAHPNVDQKATRQPVTRGLRAGDRNVLVVVRRRGNGQLIAHAPGIALR
jgi:hypothetical protein